MLQPRRDRCKSLRCVMLAAAGGRDRNHGDVKREARVAMTSNDKAARGARHLHEVYRRRAKLEPLPSDLRPDDLAEAYGMQEQLQALFTADRGADAGYKIAITTPGMPQLMGMDHPCGGALIVPLAHSL